MARRWRFLAPLRVAALVAVLVLSGCGTESPQSPPTGVDGLTIPTPSPDPADFVHGVDNPWFPLRPGATWRYRVSGDDPGTLVVSVEDATYDVAGVATTPVSRTEPDGEQVVDYYAQDTAGNVWWFGREGAWLAGRHGVEAGLAVPANPRVGDGWRAAYGSGVVDVRATVAARDQTLTTPVGTFDGLLGLDFVDALDPDRTRRIFYARGVGPVEELSTNDVGYLAELISKP